VSALTTPTSETLGKSNPLATICVPSRMSISPAAKPSSTSRNCRAEVIVSLSIRATTALGNFRDSSVSMRWMPSPNSTSFFPQAGHARGTSAVA